MTISMEYFRKKLGWCPNTKALMMDEPPETDGVPENIPKDCDAGPKWFITPAMVLLLPLLPALMFVGYTNHDPGPSPVNGIANGGEGFVSRHPGSDPYPLWSANS